MSQRYQPPTKERIEAFAASLVVWLLALARDFIAHPFDLCRVMKRAERAVECVLFLIAVRRATPPQTPKLTYIRRSAPPGFRRRKKTSRLLFKHARVRLRTGGILQRLARLIAALANPERYVARFSKLLSGGCLRGSRLIIIAPRASPVASLASAEATAVDSS